MKRKLGFLVLVVLLSVAMVSTLAYADVKTGGEVKKEAVANIKNISPDELKLKLDMGEDLVIVDVRREVQEFNIGHIKGAINSPRGLLEFRIGSKVDEDDKIIVMCASGGRSALATAQLDEMGYDVSNLKGGSRNKINED
jgi:rhodanese-related sulfurtransferase